MNPSLRALHPVALRPVGFLVLCVCFLAGCGGGGDKVTDPGTPGETTILDASPGSWTPTRLQLVERLYTNDCIYDYKDSSDLGLVLSGAVFGFHGTAGGCGNESRSCAPQGVDAVLSSGRIDFTRYSEARLRCVLRSGGAGRRGYEGGGLRGRATFAHVYVDIASNVPGTPDLRVVYREFQSNDTTETAIDVSLENALGLREATVVITLDAKADCSVLRHYGPPDWYSYGEGTGFVEVRDLRVTGKER